jgi:hypothetical protein
MLQVLCIWFLYSLINIIIKVRTDKAAHYVSFSIGRAVAQRLDAGFPPRRSGFSYVQHVGFVVDKAALG